MFPLRCVAEIL